MLGRMSVMSGVEYIKRELWISFKAYSEQFVRMTG
jgi:hypothetical protein